MSNSKSMTTGRDSYCMNCFSLIPAQAQACPVCGERMTGLSAQDYRTKLLHALEHPLDDVRMRAIIALGLRREADVSLALAGCTLRHPLNVEEGIEVVHALNGFLPSPVAQRALEILAREHGAHAVRERARTALQNEGGSVD